MAKSEACKWQQLPRRHRRRQSSKFRPHLQHFPIFESPTRVRLEVCTKKDFKSNHKNPKEGKGTRI